MRPFLPISKSDSAARSCRVFAAKKPAPICLAVASSATALAPFSQYSAILLRSSSGSGHAQLGQSNPPFLFSLLRAFNPLTNPASSKACLKLSITAGIPAAAFFKRPNFSPVNSSGFSAAGLISFSSLRVNRFYLGFRNYHFDLPLFHRDKQNLFPIKDVRHHFQTPAYLH